MRNIKKHISPLEYIKQYRRGGRTSFFQGGGSYPLLENDYPMIDSDFDGIPDGIDSANEYVWNPDAPAIINNNSDNNPDNNSNNSNNTNNNNSNNTNNNESDQNITDDGIILDKGELQCQMCDDGYPVNVAPVNGACPEGSIPDDGKTNPCDTEKVEYPYDEGDTDITKTERGAPGWHTPDPYDVGPYGKPGDLYHLIGTIHGMGTDLGLWNPGFRGEDEATTTTTPGATEEQIEEQKETQEEVVCQKCDEGYPVNIASVDGKCPEGSVPDDGTNPCTGEKKDTEENVNNNNESNDNNKKNNSDDNILNEDESALTPAENIAQYNESMEDLWNDPQGDSMFWTDEMRQRHRDRHFHEDGTPKTQEEKDAEAKQREIENRKYQYYDETDDTWYTQHPNMYDENNQLLPQYQNLAEQMYGGSIPYFQAGGSAFQVGADGKPQSLFTKNDQGQAVPNETPVNPYGSISATNPNAPAVPNSVFGYTDDMTPQEKHQRFNEYKDREAELKEEERRGEMSFMEKINEDYTLPAAKYTVDKYDRYQAGEDPMELAIETMNDLGKIKYIGKIPGMIGGAADMGAGVAQGDWDRVTKGAGNIVTSGFKTGNKGADSAVTELKNPQLAARQGGGTTDESEYEQQQRQFQFANQQDNMNFQGPNTDYMGAMNANPNATNQPMIGPQLPDQQPAAVDMDPDQDGIPIGIDATPEGDEGPNFNPPPSEDEDGDIACQKCEGGYPVNVAPVNGECPEGSSPDDGSDPCAGQQQPAKDETQEETPPAAEEEKEEKKEEDKEGRPFKPFKAAIKAAEFVNAWSRNRADRKAKRLAMRKTSADYVFGDQATDATNKGQYDVNTGMQQPDKQVYARQGKYGVELPKASMGLEWLKNNYPGFDQLSHDEQQQVLNQHAKSQNFDGYSGDYKDVLDFKEQYRTHGYNPVISDLPSWLRKTREGYGRVIIDDEMERRMRGQLAGGKLDPHIAKEYVRFLSGYRGPAAIDYNLERYNKYQGWDPEKQSKFNYPGVAHGYKDDLPGKGPFDTVYGDYSPSTLAAWIKMADQVNQPKKYKDLDDEDVIAKTKRDFNRKMKKDVFAYEQELDNAADEYWNEPLAYIPEEEEYEEDPFAPEIEGYANVDEELMNRLNRSKEEIVSLPTRNITSLASNNNFELPKRKLVVQEPVVEEDDIWARRAAKRAAMFADEPVEKIVKETKEKPYTREEYAYVPQSQRKDGGEEMDLDPETISQLIALGADIEIL